MSLTLNTKVYPFTGIMAGITSYVYRGLGLAALFSDATIQVRLDTMSRIHAKLKVVNPVAVAEGCCATEPVAGVMDVDIKVRLPLNATVAERTDFALRLKDFVGTPEFQAAITNLAQPSA